MKSNDFTEESRQDWGGKCTKDKLDAFSKYVWSYLTIMKKYPYWQTIYFDGFAGSGTNKSRCDSALYQQLSLDPSEVKLYQGSAERVLTVKDNLSFDYYYFIDSDNDNLNKLKTRLTPFQKEHKIPFQFREGDCNNYLVELGDVMRRKKKEYASLVLLDPFGMQVRWDSINSLKNTRTDVWLLVPTGVIVNRLLDKSGKLKNIKKLESFFGLPELVIKEYFYKSETVSTLFGDETELVVKVTKPILKIADLYLEQLKKVWKSTTEKPLVLRNSKNVPIFHFVFASNNESAVKIASQIIEDDFL